MIMVVPPENGYLPAAKGSISAAPESLLAIEAKEESRTATYGYANAF